MVRRQRSINCPETSLVGKPEACVIDGGRNGVFNLKPDDGRWIYAAVVAMARMVDAWMHCFLGGDDLHMIPARQGCSRVAASERRWHRGRHLP